MSTTFYSIVNSVSKEAGVDIEAVEKMEVNKEETDQIKHQRKNTNEKEKNTLNRAKEIQPSSRPSSKSGT